MAREAGDEAAAGAVVADIAALRAGRPPRASGVGSPASGRWRRPGCRRAAGRRRARPAARRRRATAPRSRRRGCEAGAVRAAHHHPPERLAHGDAARAGTGSARTSGTGGRAACWRGRRARPSRAWLTAKARILAGGDLGAEHDVGGLQRLGDQDPRPRSRRPPCAGGARRAAARCGRGARPRWARQWRRRRDRSASGPTTERPRSGRPDRWRHGISPVPPTVDFSPRHPHPEHHTTETNSGIGCSRSAKIGEKNRVMCCMVTMTTK